MKNKEAHNVTQIFRQVLASALLLVVLLSSCSLKRGVKVLFDIPIKMEQAGRSGQYISSVENGKTTFIECTDFQVFTAKTYDQSLLKDLSQSIFISVVFSLFLLPFFRLKEEHIYNLPPQGRSIPKYLLFSKLLFYDIR
ncbi:hypothetical protein [Arenibacter lacus]|uniref:hypothetical protein n=1 Tax=Arenibacter lacus TaxID=2608629 RepID=UPI00123CEBBB|nr:hypothetical protein [Arenibacter lacus]